MQNYQKDLSGKIPPKKLQGVLWSASVDDLDLWRDRVYIIHHTLMYGNFSQISWLQTTYPTELIQKTFTEKPMKVYSKTGFHYIKNYILDLSDKGISPDKYVNTFYGPSGR